jgi:cell shape-determining protein MreD
MDPWFDSRTAGLIGGIIGTALGVTGGVIGSLCGICVQKGWKKLIYTLFIIAIAASSVLLITGIVALLCKQPYHVWYPFLLPGLLGTGLFSILLSTIGKRFTEYELRKMQAKDL